MKTFYDLLTESDSSEKFMELKRSMYSEAKKNYIEALQKRLEEIGIEVLNYGTGTGKEERDKREYCYQNIDSYQYEKFRCKFQGHPFVLDMSSRGVSLTLRVEMWSKENNRLITDHENSLSASFTTLGTLKKALDKWVKVMHDTRGKRKGEAFNF